MTRFPLKGKVSMIAANIMVIELTASLKNTGIVQSPPSLGPCSMMISWSVTQKKRSDTMLSQQPPCLHRLYRPRWVGRRELSSLAWRRCLAFWHVRSWLSIMRIGMLFLTMSCCRPSKGNDGTVETWTVDCPSFVVSVVSIPKKPSPNEDVLSRYT